MDGEPARAGPIARFRADLLAGARRDRALYAIALTVLVTGFAMQPVTGNHPDWAIVLALGLRLSIGVGAAALAALAWRLGWLAVVARSRTPTRDLIRWIASFFRGDGLAANAIHTFAIFFVFGAGFAVLKGAIAVIAPFAWDAALADLDRALHFGRYPHEWLQPLLGQPLIVSAFNYLYNTWFLILLAGFVACACATRRRTLRHQYLMSFMLVWFVGGFLVATGFSSAGPTYYARIGLGDLYAPLMQALHAAAERYPIWATETQDVLWQGFTGGRRGSAGISAFPSMHVATATLFALAARHLRPWLFAFAVLHWAVIMTGSVLLAWHYAADGYAATLIAILGWRIAGLYGRRMPGTAAAIEADA
jgi:hypothetical protein